MKDVAWGYVTRDMGTGKELLIATRYHPNDPLRRGQLVIPGGGLKRSEKYVAAAIREVREETGLVTRASPVQFRFQLVEFENAGITGAVREDGRVFFRYKDSGKEYLGKVVNLSPKDRSQEPAEQLDSDARNPRYITVGAIYGRMKRDFTPACIILLDLIYSAELLPTRGHGHA